MFAASQPQDNTNRIKKLTTQLEEIRQHLKINLAAIDTSSNDPLEPLKAIINGIKGRYLDEHKGQWEDYKNLKGLVEQSKHVANIVLDYVPFVSQYKFREVAIERPSASRHLNSAMQSAGMRFHNWYSNVLTTLFVAMKSEKSSVEFFSTLHAIRSAIVYVYKSNPALRPEYDEIITELLFELNSIQSRIASNKSLALPVTDLEKREYETLQVLAYLEHDESTFNFKKAKDPAGYIKLPTTYKYAEPLPNGLTANMHKPDQLQNGFYLSYLIKEANKIITELKKLSGHEVVSIPEERGVFEYELIEVKDSVKLTDIKQLSPQHAPRAAKADVPPPPPPPPPPAISQPAVDNSALFIERMLNAFMSSQVNQSNRPQQANGNAYTRPHRRLSNDNGAATAIPRPEDLDPVVKNTHEALIAELPRNEDGVTSFLQQMKLKNEARRLKVAEVKAAEAKAKHDQADMHASATTATSSEPPVPQHAQIPNEIEPVVMNAEIPVSAGDVVNIETPATHGEDENSDQEEHLELHDDGNPETVTDNAEQALDKGEESEEEDEQLIDRRYNRP